MYKLINFEVENPGHVPNVAQQCGPSVAHAK